MKKSLIVSFLVMVAIFAGLYVIAKIETTKKIEHNFALAKDAFENSQLEYALRLLEANPPAKIAQDYYVLKYDILMNQNKLNEAETVAQKLVKLDKKNALNHYLLSLVYYNFADYSKAEASLKNAIKYAPKNNDFKIHLADLYANLQRYDEAVKLFAEVKKSDSNYEVAWDGLAAVSEDKQDYSKALELRKEAAEKFPNNCYDSYMLAALYQKMGDKKKAVTFYEKAARLDKEGESDAQEQYQELTGKPFYIASASTSQKIPALFVDNLPIITVFVDGDKGNFLLDTGANTSVIYERFLRKNKIQVDTDTYGILEFANGKKQTAPACHVDFKIGNSIFESNRIFILPDFKGITFDGIIGNDILAKTDFYIDRKNETVIIKR